ncbi:MAG TPA: aquaporin [Pyrinomonadaceae bacterium]
MELSHLSGGSVPASAGPEYRVGVKRAASVRLGCSVRMREALKNHWPEYMIEAAGLCLFMISACVFAALIFHPSSPVGRTVTAPFLQRVLMGTAMAMTSAAIIYSPWGKRSGAHVNPSVTLAFFRLGKIEPWDALLYILAQFAGAMTGVFVAGLLLGPLIADPSVKYVTTLPGSFGLGAAFLGELLISFLLMTAVLAISNSKRWAGWTGICAAALVAVYISLEAPLSGMSMNPARTFGSAFSARLWTALWVYFTAPPLGMLLAAEAYVRLRGKRNIACAKLHHRNSERCIFRCGYKRTSS